MSLLNKNYESARSVRLIFADHMIKRRVEIGEIKAENSINLQAHEYYSMRELLLYRVCVQFLFDNLRRNMLIC